MDKRRALAHETVWGVTEGSTGPLGTCSRIPEQLSELLRCDTWVKRRMWICLYSLHSQSSYTAQEHPWDSGVFLRSSGQWDTAHSGMCHLCGQQPVGTAPLEGTDPSSAPSHAQLAQGPLLLVGCLSKALQGGCFHHCLTECHHWISHLKEQKVCKVSSIFLFVKRLFETSEHLQGKTYEEKPIQLALF